MPYFVLEPPHPTYVVEQTGVTISSSEHWRFGPMGAHPTAFKTMRNARGRADEVNRRIESTRNEGNAKIIWVDLDRLVILEVMSDKFVPPSTTPDGELAVAERQAELWAKRAADLQYAQQRDAMSMTACHSQESEAEA